jgi:hypothetical protein
MSISHPFAPESTRLFLAGFNLFCSAGAILHSVSLAECSQGISGTE